MRRVRVLILGILLILCLAACQKNDADLTLADGNEIQLTNEVSQEADSSVVQGDDTTGKKEYISVGDVEGDAETDFSKYENKPELTNDSAKEERKENRSSVNETVDREDKSENISNEQDNAVMQSSDEDGGVETSEQSSSNDNDQKAAAKDKKRDEAKEDQKEQADTQAQQEKVCTLVIECSTVLSNMDKLKEGKESIVPANGVIYGTRTVAIQEGDTVFDILQREMQSNRIAFEYVSTPVYGGNYIEGINNLYEFDCGELSGWMYSVNGVYPNYGCSQYEVKAGDQIAFRYTCDLGKDLGR